MCSECYISALFQLDYWFSSTRVFGKFVWNDLSWKILPFGNTNNCCAGVKNLTFLICVLRFMYCCKEGGFEMSFVKKIFNFWGTYNCCAGVKDLVFFFFYLCVEIYVLLQRRVFVKIRNDFSWKVLPFGKLFVVLV